MAKILKTVLIIGAAIALVVFAAPIAGFLTTTLASIGVTATIAASTIVGLGLSLGLAAAASLFQKTPTLSNSLSSRESLNPDTAAPRKIVFGTTAAGCDVRFKETYGSKSDQLAMVIALASHELTNIQSVTVDAGSDPIVVWQNGGTVGGNKYANGFNEITPYTVGTPSNGRPVGSGNYWRSTASFTGCSYMVLSYKLDPKVWVDGLPAKITTVVDGVPVYDPRLDSTNGGSGAMRPDNQASWSFNSGGVQIGRNPALALLTFLLGWKINGKLVWGMGIPTTRINFGAFITYANLCEEQVVAAGGGTVQRYTCDGIFSTADSFQTVINTICLSMGTAILVDVDGVYTLIEGYDDTLTVPFALTGDDIVSPGVWSPSPAARERITSISGRFADPTQQYVLNEWGSIDVDPLHDGIPRSQTVDFGCVSRPETAQRIAKQMLVKSKYGGVYSAVFGFRAFGTEVGSLVSLSLGPQGFNNKLFRVIKQEESLDLLFSMQLREESPEIYEWDSSEEVPLPTNILETTYDAIEAENVEGLAINARTVDGTNSVDTIFIDVTWTPPHSLRTQSIEIQSQPVNGIAAIWTTEVERFAEVATGHYTFAAGVNGAGVKVQARYRMSNGAFGAWVSTTIASTPVSTVNQWSSVFGENRPADNADVTANHTSADTRNVAGTPAATVASNAATAIAAVTGSNGQIIAVDALYDQVFDLVAAVGDQATANQAAVQAEHSNEAANAAAANATTSANQAAASVNAAQVAQAAALSDSQLADTAKLAAQAAAATATAAQAATTTEAGLATTARIDAQAATTAANTANAQAAAAAAAAQGFSTSAQAFAGQASDSASSAAGSAASASSNSGIAVQAKNDATNYANAAQVSANLASTKADAAGSSATSAQASLTAANTARGGAESAQSSAATSASNALGSANSAASSAGVSATAKDGAVKAAAQILPASFGVSDQPYWIENEATYDATTVYDSSFFGPADYPVFATKAGQSRVVATRGTFIPTVGRRYRISLEIARVANVTNGRPSILYMGLTRAGTNGAVDQAVMFGIDAQVSLPSNQWTTFSFDWIADSTSWWARPRLHWNWDNAGTAFSDAVYHIRHLGAQDVTEAYNAGLSASAAATSASNASASQTAAGQSASASQQSATNASTSAGSANTYANNASTSASNALSSAQAAEQKSGVAAGSATTATNAANAAAGSANQASTSATSAGEKAAAAQAAATAATTSAGNANTYANNASTSASNAEGSASSALSSAGVSANASTAAQAIADRLYPKSFTNATLASFDYSGDGFLVGPDSSWPQPYLMTFDNSVGGPRYVQHKQMHNKIVGQRFRLTYWVWTASSNTRVATVVAMTNNSDRSNLVGAQVDDVRVPADCYSSDSTSFPTQQFVKFGLEWTATSATAAFIHPYVYVNPTEAGTSSANGYRTHVCGFDIEDITSEYASGKSAAAAATSASSAAASNSGAGEQASAALQQATNAQTYAGQASTSASQASTSASNALSSSQNAEQKSTIATTAATNANNSASSSAGSANQASTSATSAAQSATSSSASATAASTSAGSAGTYASNASTSANNALGSANSAASSAGVSATASTAAQAAADRTFPKEFSPTTISSFTVSGNYSLVGPDKSWPQPYMVTYNDVGAHYIHHKATHIKNVGQRMRLTFWVFTYSPYTRVAVYFGQSNSSDLSSGGSGYTPLNGAVPTGCIGSDNTGFPVQQFFKFGWEGTIDASAQAFIYPEIYINPGEGGTPATTTTHVCGFVWEDVTSEYASLQSAAASANSASSAAASQSGAGQQASAALQQAVNAQTYAGQAGTSASNAAVSASNAAGSAQSASTSANLSASAKDASLGALALQFPASLDPTSRNAWNLEGNASVQGPAGWPNPYAWYTTGNTNSQISVLSRTGIPCVVGERYRVTAWVWTDATNAYVFCYGGGNNTQANWYDGSIAGIDSTNQTTPAGCIANATLMPRTNWYKVGIEYTINGANPLFQRPVITINSNGNGNINGQAYISAPTFEKITSEAASKGFADASNNSASSAAASSSSAGNSASAANQSRIDAQAANSAAQGAASSASGSATSADQNRAQAATYASNAATYASQSLGSANAASSSANNAQTYASQANASAASAQTSATLSATINSTSSALNRNSKFQAWPDGASVPTSWVPWSYEAGTITRDISRQSGGFAALMKANNATNLGISQTFYIVPGYYILSATVWLQSGTWLGAGLYVDSQTHLNFSADKDSTGGIYSVGGGIRTFSKLINVMANTGDVNIYAMTNWDGFGTRDVKTLQWMEAGIRLASDAEVQAQAATQNISALTATVNNTSTAVATLQSQAATTEQRLLAGQPNLLVNSTFESGYTNWNVSTPPGTNIGTGLSAAWGYAFTGYGSYTGGPYGMLQSKNIPVYAGASYTVSADTMLFANTAAAYCYFDMLFLDANGTVVGDGGQNQMYASQDFSVSASKRLTYAHTDTAPSNAVSAVVRFIVDAAGGTVTNFGIRRIKFEIGSTMSGYSAEASAAYQAGVLADHSGKLASYVSLTASAGGTAAAVKLVATDGAGNTYSGVALEAQQITLANGDGSNKKVALSLQNGDATFSGALNVGADSGGNRLKITNQNLTVFDANGTRRVAFGLNF